MYVHGVRQRQTFQVQGRQTAPRPFTLHNYSWSPPRSAAGLLNHDRLVSQAEIGQRRKIGLMSEGWGGDFRMAGAIAVQAFNKAESVIGTLDSIVRSRGSHNYHLVILQDGCSGPKQTEKYRAALAETG